MPTNTIVLQFFPGHFPPKRANIGPNYASVGAGLLLALGGNVCLFRGEAWGGPSEIVPIKGEPSYTPTPPGHYLLLEPAPYTTSTWRFSEIRWGTPIEDSPVDPTDVWYVVSMRGGRETWASTKKDFGITRKEIIEYFGRLAGATKTAIPKCWRLLS